MATFVPVAQQDEPGVADPALDLARHIQVINGGDPSTVGDIPDQKALDLALENLDKIFAQAGEKEKERESIEGVLNVVCWLFQRVLENNTAPAESVTLADKFLKKLTSDTTTHPILRLKMLSTIYNILGGNGTARYNTFLAIVEYAAAAGKDHLSLVSPQFAQLDTMLAEWGTDVAKTRTLYQTIFDAMAKFGDSHGAHQYRLKFLTSFQGDSALEAAKPQAKTAVSEAIANPKVYQFDAYLELDAVQALKNDSKDGKLHELLTLFASKDLGDFNTFYSANSAYVDSLGLKKEDCVLKMRLLSLCTLASAKREIKYAEIASCLEVKEEEVEQWAIKAITAKLMDAKMDQLNKIVCVSHCTDRMFSQEQWKVLRSQLVGWKDRMKQLMVAIDNSRQFQQQQMMQMQSQMQGM
eukprot:CAMPEP_0181310816 /NCGR_PEP_ID=MMETSP1101-20121128/12792_1 /TAXON_ID=46948 /ORGANISM="Rhodomonas abbreviata, Strain Caron Lab Isolate" /LENGTH=410 /DNA_ID=CAMNT_0023417479 /DNA_START=18 /DNA_END=1250 /DNA_ORIENTATION=+